MNALSSKTAILLVSFLTIFCCSIALAQATTPVLESWKLPLKLDNSNTSIEFKVDSTWHTVHGVCRSIIGEVGYSNNSTDLQINVRAAVKDFDTDGESRDEEMREVMAAEKFPDVIFQSTSFTHDCGITGFKADCNGILKGDLRIRETTKKFEIPVYFKPEGNSLKANGNFELNWDDFGVEDPSILIARLDKKVAISFSVLVPIK